MSGQLSNRWWYAAGQSSQGPVSLARLQQLFAERRISENTYVVDKVAIAIWTPISAVPNLLDHLKYTVRDPNEPDTPPLPADVAKQSPSKLDLSSIPKDKKKNKALSRRRHEDPRAWANRVDEYVHKDEDYYADISPRRERNGASKKSSQDVRGDVSQSRRKKDVQKDDGDRRRRRPRWDDEDSDDRDSRRRKRRDDDYSSEDDRRGSRRRRRRDDYSDSESSDKDRHRRRRKHRRRRDDSYSDSESDEPRRRQGKRKKDKKPDEDNDKSGDSRSESDEEPRPKKERKEKGSKGKERKGKERKGKRKIHVEGLTSSEDDKEAPAPKKKSQDVRGSISGPRKKPPPPEPNSEDEYSDPDDRKPSEKPKKVGASDEDEYEDPDEGKAKPAQRRKRKIIVEGLNDGPDGGPLGGGAGGLRSSGQDARGRLDPRDYVRGPDPGRRAPPGGMGMGMGIYGDEGGRGDMPGRFGGMSMGRGPPGRGPPGRGPPGRGPPMGGGFGRGPPMGGRGPEEQVGYGRPGGSPMRGRGPPPMGTLPEGRPGMTGQTESNIRVYDDGNIQLRTKRGSQDGRRRGGNPEDEYEDPDDDGDIGGGSLLERNSHLNFERGSTLQRERAWSYLRREGRVGAPGSQQRRMMANAILVEGQIPEEAAFQKMTDRGNFTDPTQEQMTYAPQKTGGGGGFGGGAPGDRPGDWTCGQCGTVNFSSRRECFGCGVPKGQADAQTVGT